MTKRKNTDDLMEELKNKSTDINEYIDENSEDFIEVNLKDFWSKMLDKSKKAKSDIVNNADISYIYFYEITQGKKLPSKDKIIRIMISMELDLEDCQNALRFCNQSILYPRIKRDSVIIYALEHGLSLYKTQEMLIKAGEPELK